MLPLECNFKNELDNSKKSHGKFYARDLEIRRACYYCRINMDQDSCILFQIHKNTLLEEINNRKDEIIRLQEYIEYIDELKNQKENKEKEIINLNKEIEMLNNKAVKIRANDFLRTTIGVENYLFYMNNGYLDVIGTNNSIYRITNDGKISKMKMIKKGFTNRIKDFIVEFLTIFTINYCQKKKKETWVGKIKATNYPLEDAIATVYMNIIKNSDRFDIDKGCGSIFLN